MSSGFKLYRFEQESIESEGVLNSEWMGVLGASQVAFRVTSAHPASGVAAAITDTSTTVQMQDTTNLSAGVTVAGDGIPEAATIASVDTATNTKTCTTVVDDATVLCADTSGLAVGQGVYGDGIPAGALIESIVEDTSFELSLPATADGEDVDLSFAQVTLSAAATATDTDVALTYTNVQLDGASCDVEVRHSKTSLALGLAATNTPGVSVAPTLANAFATELSGAHALVVAKPTNGPYFAIEQMRLKVVAQSGVPLPGVLIEAVVLTDRPAIQGAY